MESAKSCLKVLILYIAQFSFLDQGQLFFLDSQQEQR